MSLKSEGVENEAKARYEPIDRKQNVLEQVDVEELIGEEHAARISRRRWKGIQTAIYGSSVC